MNVSSARWLHSSRDQLLDLKAHVSAMKAAHYAYRQYSHVVSRLCVGGQQQHVVACVLPIKRAIADADCATLTGTTEDTAAQHISLALAV